MDVVCCDLLLMEKKLKHGGMRRASIGEGGFGDRSHGRKGGVMSYRMYRRPTIKGSSNQSTSDTVLLTCGARVLGSRIQEVHHLITVLVDFIVRWSVVVAYYMIYGISGRDYCVKQCSQIRKTNEKKHFSERCHVSEMVPFWEPGESLLNIIVASSELVGWAQDCTVRSKMGTVAPRGHAGFFSSSSSHS